MKILPARATRLGGKKKDEPLTDKQRIDLLEAQLAIVRQQLDEALAHVPNVNISPFRAICTGHRRYC